MLSDVVAKIRSRVRFMNMLWLQHFRLMVSGTFKDWNVLFFFVKLPKTENTSWSLNFVWVQFEEFQKQIGWCLWYSKRKHIPIIRRGWWQIIVFHDNYRLKKYPWFYQRFYWSRSKFSHLHHKKWNFRRISTEGSEAKKRECFLHVLYKGNVF